MLPFPLVLPPDRRDSRRAAIRAALLPPKTTGAAVVGCIPAAAARPVGIVDNRRAVGCIDGLGARAKGFRGDLRALAGGRCREGTESDDDDDVARRAGRRAAPAAASVGGGMVAFSIVLAPAASGVSDGLGGRFPAESRRIAFSDRIGPM